MKTEQLKLVLERFAKQHAGHVLFARSALQRIENLERALRLLSETLLLPGVPERRALLEQVAALTARADDPEAAAALAHGLAQLEREQEHLEAIIAELRDENI